MKCYKCGKEFPIEDANWCPYCGKRPYKVYWTKEEDAFLIKYKDVDREELAQMFNEKFNSDKTGCSVRHRLHKLGVSMSKEARYSKIKDHPTNLPIGTERFYRDVVWVKVSDENAHHAKTRYDSPCWKRKHYMVWEEHYGAVPEGNVITFLDGNSRNCDISNLRCVPKGVAIMVNSPHAFKTNTPETKNAAIDCALLLHKIKEKKNESHRED